MVKPLASFCGNPAMFRQRERATCCTLAALHPSVFSFHLCSLNKRHDLYLIATLWVVATRLEPFLLFLSFQVSHQVGRKARLNAVLHSKLQFQRKRGNSERWRRSSAGCECMQALAGEKKAKTLAVSEVMCVCVCV